MSTRANIAVIDRNTDPEWPILLYKHGDGYPDGVKRELDTFVGWVNDRRLRQSPSQSSGWLILLGIKQNLQYHTEEWSKMFVDSVGNPSYADCKAAGERLTAISLEPGPPGDGIQWQVGAYEPTEYIAGDADWYHVVYLGDRFDNRYHFPKELLEKEGLTLPEKPAFWKSFRPGPRNTMANCIAKTQKEAEKARAKDVNFQPGS